MNTLINQQTPQSEQMKANRMATQTKKYFGSLILYSCFLESSNAQLQLRTRQMMSTTTKMMLMAAIPLFALIFAAKVEQSVHARSREKSMRQGEWQISQERQFLNLKAALSSLSSYFLSSQSCRQTLWTYFREPVQRQVLMRGFPLLSVSSRQTLHSRLQFQSGLPLLLSEPARPEWMEREVPGAVMISWLVNQGSWGQDIYGSLQKIVQNLYYHRIELHLINYQIQKKIIDLRVDGGGQGRGVERRACLTGFLNLFEKDVKQKKHHKWSNHNPAWNYQIIKKDQI